MTTTNSSICPFCYATVSSSELQRHANNHFEDDQVARDMEFALQLAQCPESPSQSLNNQANSNVSFDTGSGKRCESSISRHGGTRGDGDIHIDEKICCLMSLQIRSNFYKVGDGLMALLRYCLESETENTTSVLSGYVDHFQSIESEDVGWGCGWRNIQMLSSHLLMQRQEARELLFGGSGFVPDIASLQRWLEIAWERGFDALGSNQFDHKIYGSANWIGTTECAALFRSFGLQARIVDFGPKEIDSLFLSVPGSRRGAQRMNTSNRGKRKAVQVHGPMDRFLLRRDQNAPQAGSIWHEKSSYSSIHLEDGLSSRSSDDPVDNDKFDNCSARKIESHQVLLDWVWTYFFDNRFTKSGDHHVFVSEKAPLYFQHDGHSRTIVGIQVKHQQKGMPQYNLLVLDPAHRTAALERSLKSNIGWQKLVKRGAHTLKKSQYQLCYIDPGIAHEEEMEQLKTLDSVFFEF